MSQPSTSEVPRPPRATEDDLKSLFKPTGVIQTASGAAYDFADPQVESIKLTDIAHALSNMCRFAGHTSTFYSVAEHCVFVSYILDAEGATEGWQKIGLLHDAHEAYVWDCPRPLKPLLGNVFSDLADKADDVICAALGVSHRELFHAACIKHADDTALKYEADQLMHHGTKHWSQQYQEIGPPPDGVPFWTLGMSPQLAESAFLSRCTQLGVES